MVSILNLNWQGSPAGLSLAKRISEAVITEIREGRLRPGAKLPSTRSLGLELKVHRNTVVSAYDELIAQGYVETKQGSGSFVTEALPEAVEKRATKRQARLLDLNPAPCIARSVDLPPGVLPLLGGLPDLRTLPTKALSRALRAAVKAAPRGFDYQDAGGQPRFIAALSKYLWDTRGVRSEIGEILITRGSQQALYLAAKALAKPGTVFAVEGCGYPPAWESFRLAGATVVPVGVDAEGLIVDDLAALTQRHKVSGVYVTPHHQYPTTVTMSGARRMALMQLARREGFVILEDDYDHEYHFSNEPVLPLASADEEGVVLHIGTLSKVLAPGLRVGYAVGQRSLISHMTATRRFIDRQGDHVGELALAYLMEDGEITAHIRRMQRSYDQRRQVFFAELARKLPEELQFEAPPGGLALWARVQGKVSALEWSRRALERGVMVQAAASLFYDEQNHPYLRLGFARLDEGELCEAVARLRSAYPPCGSR